MLKRTIVNLPEEFLRELAEICARRGMSRSEAVRDALARYLEAHRAAAGDAAFGLWAGRGIDGRAFEEGLRGEWERT